MRKSGFLALGEDGIEITLRRHNVDAKGANLPFREAPARKHSILTGISLQQQRVQPIDRTKKAPYLQLEPWTSTWKLSKNILRGNVTSSPCKKELNSLSKSSWRIASTWHTLEDVWSCSTRIVSFLASRSRPFTFYDIRGCQQDDVMEGESGWVLQGAISRASFRWQLVSGPKSFTVTALHINSNCSKKRGIGKKLLLTFRAVMIEELVDLVAGHFNVVAWCRSYGHGRQPRSIIEGADTDTDLPMPPGLSPLWFLGAVPGEGAHVCGFLNPLDSHERWKVRLHGAFTFLPSTLDLHPKDQSCHHEAWLHLAFWTIMVTTNREKRREQRLLLKERSAPYQPNKERGTAVEDESDRSLSS